jgi:hypothetical protein
VSENVKILLEITKYYGRDVNVMEVYSLFKGILKKGHEKYDDQEFKSMFLQALQELKYMGYVS